MPNPSWLWRCIRLCSCKRYACNMREKCCIWAPQEYLELFLLHFWTQSRSGANAKSQGKSRKMLSWKLDHNRLLEIRGQLVAVSWSLVFCCLARATKLGWCTPCKELDGLHFHFCSLSWLIKLRAGFQHWTRQLFWLVNSISCSNYSFHPIHILSILFPYDWARR